MEEIPTYMGGLCGGQGKGEVREGGAPLSRKCKEALRKPVWGGVCGGDPCCSHALGLPGGKKGKARAVL